MRIHESTTTRNTSSCFLVGTIHPPIQTTEIEDNNQSNTSEKRNNQTNGTERKTTNETRERHGRIKTRGLLLRTSTLKSLYRIIHSMSSILHMMMMRMIMMIMMTIVAMVMMMETRTRIHTC